VLASVAACLAGTSSVAGAVPASGSPWWSLSAGARPSVFEPEGTGQLVVTAVNVGNGPVLPGGEPAVLVDRLPAGLKATAAAAALPQANNRPSLPCSVEAGGTRVSCTVSSEVLPFAAVEMSIAVDVLEEAHSGEVNEVSVSGGGAPGASAEHPIAVSDRGPAFGVEDYGLVNEEAGGAPDVQAGSHPFQQTTTVAFEQTASSLPVNGGSNAEPVQLVRDLHFRWPPGLIGDPQVIPRCTSTQFLTAQGAEDENECPPDTAVGVATVTVDEPHTFHLTVFTVPLFNLEPERGEPARFGFNIVEANAPVYIDAAVRSGGDYGVTVSSSNVSQTAGLLSSNVTVWGVPGSAAHDAQRGWGCLLGSLHIATEQSCATPEQHNSPPFLSMPASCSGPLSTVVEADSWAAPGVFSSLAAPALPAMVGCNQLPFKPLIMVAPEGQNASSPSGLTVDVHVPQEESLNTNGLAASDVKDITVALPEGVVTDPSGADGLQACPEGLAGFTGFAEYLTGDRTATFTSSLPSPLQSGVNFCADAAKIGTLTIKTPILANPLKGAVYLATQNENPFGSLVALYLIAEDPVSGVLVRLAGQVHLSETGQIVATFENNPQAPFEDAELHFFGGERAPLATPSHCGGYTTQASLAPWSGNAAAQASSTFQITAGPNGTPCPGSTLPAGASLTGGVSAIDAGEFTPLTTTISREDGAQDIRSVQLHTPRGLLGILTGVKLCGEAEANAGTCPAESLIGETTVSVGLGGDPYTVKGGRVYLTGPYAGAPFGLSIVNSAKAGPFDLGSVVVRAKIEVDPHTAALTVTTDPSGPHAIPRILDGIPLEIKHVNVTVNRHDFTFNPTNCNPMAIDGTIAGVEGAMQPFSVPFQVTNCAALAFKPSFKVSTQANTSKKNGASLDVKVGSGVGQANIGKVAVALPKQLPSRLTTIQQACPAATFNANPASCPAGSLIGTATASTPVLANPVAGPAYLVSHGGAAFPDLVLILQGEGIKLELIGSINIRKGVTSSAFNSVPDAPISTFELKLPEGPHSGLASVLPAKAKGSLCGTSLVMPTTLTGQNGAVLEQNTKIQVTGCPKTKKKPAKKNHKKGKKKK
jgi:hypothetical protein